MPEKKTPDATPAAEELAEERGIDTDDVEGTGLDGRVTKGDVEDAPVAEAPAVVEAAPVAEPSEPATDLSKDEVTFELIPPNTRFEMGVHDGSLLLIEADAKGVSSFSTDDPRVIGELDSQNHAVRRVVKK